MDDLERQLSRQERAGLVLEKYKRFAGGKTLAFCVSINHANYMVQYFNQHNVPSAAVHSGPAEKGLVMDRTAAISALESGRIKVIFAVDIFNEGVDIPSIDSVMFLRPTESFVVFLQQLGRGLRKDQGKECLTVLDFIGNYKRAHYIPALLAGENPMHPRGVMQRKPSDYIYPENCQVQFDFNVLDLFEALAKSDPLKKRMTDDYFRLQDSLGRRPTRVDLFEGSDIPIREFLKNGWLRFLEAAGELELQELRWLGTPAEDFLKVLEKTPMTRAYKIPTISAVLEGSRINRQVPLAQVGEYFMSFYTDHAQHQKDLRDKSNRNWKAWGLKEFTDLAKRNPVHFLSKGRFFNYDEINQVFYLSEELEPYLGSELAGHVMDILEYRRRDYFRKRFREDD